MLPLHANILRTLILCIVFHSRIFADSCGNLIYCTGEMYEAFQNAVTDDFVNKKLVIEPEETLIQFNNFTRHLRFTQNMIATNSRLGTYFNATVFQTGKYAHEFTDVDVKQEIERFVESHFQPEVENEDFEAWKLPDKMMVNISKTVTDRNMAEFVNYLTNLLPKLAIKGANRTLQNRNRFSIRAVNGFIKKHRNAREASYWETYWVVNGFLLCEMYQTVKVILDNLISMVIEHGFVPKANRVYYTQRSNPPVLTLMAFNYFIRSKDYEWLKANIKHLDRELMFWFNNRSVTITKRGESYWMFRYIVDCTSPRPESFKRDEGWGEIVPDKHLLFKEIHSASESGWDFSSRWLFDKAGKVSKDGIDLNVTRVIPVDLNAYLYKNFVHIARIYSILNDNVKKQFWERKSQDLEHAIQTILWNPFEGIWNDYDIQLDRHRNYYFISNLVPLWAKAYPSSLADTIGDLASNYLDRYELVSKYRGCLPDTLNYSRELYDFPNSHTHLVTMVIQGLKNTNSRNAVRKANILVANWMDAVMACWAETETVFDTYSAEEFGQHVSYQDWNEDHSVTVGAFLEMLDGSSNLVEKLLSSSASATPIYVSTLLMSFILFLYTVLSCSYNLKA